MRVEGFVDEIRRSFPKMNLVGVQTSYDDAKEVEKIICKTIDAFPDLAGIFVVSGGQDGIQAALKTLNLKNRPAIIVYDQTQNNEEALLNDSIDFLIDQEEYVQGYRPLKLLADCMENKPDFHPGYYYTDIRIKTKYNL
jgi:LacI family transcriptional regulator